jgi:hypothetical protein
VSRHTPRSRVRIDELTDELTVAAAMRLRCDAEDIRRVIEAVVAYLVQEYPSQDLYIPSSSALPLDAIRAAIAEGRSMRWICANFRSDRRTIYRLMEAANDG